jgi:hypothetical protein
MHPESQARFHEYGVCLSFFRLTPCLRSCCIGAAHAPKPSRIVLPRQSLSQTTEESIRWNRWEGEMLLDGQPPAPRRPTARAASGEPPSRFGERVTRA